MIPPVTREPVNAKDLALECKERKEEKTIVFCLSGHGYPDLYEYEQYLEVIMMGSRA